MLASAAHVGQRDTPVQVRCASKLKAETRGRRDGLTDGHHVEPLRAVMLVDVGSSFPADFAGSGHWSLNIGHWTTGQ